MTSSRALTTHAPVRPNATRSCRKPRFIVHDDQEHTGRPPRQRQRGGPRRLAPRWPPIRHQPAPPYGGPTLSVASDPLGRRAHQRVDRTGSSNSMRNGRSDGRPPQHARGAPLGVGSHTALTRSLDERLSPVRGSRRHVVVASGESRLVRGRIARIDVQGPHERGRCAGPEFVSGDISGHRGTGRPRRRPDRSLLRVAPWHFAPIHAPRITRTRPVETGPARRSLGPSSWTAVTTVTPCPITTSFPGPPIHPARSSNPG